MESSLIRAVGACCLIYFLFTLFSGIEVAGWITAIIGLISWSLYFLISSIEKGTAKQENNK